MVDVLHDIPGNTIIPERGLIMNRISLMILIFFACFIAVPAYAEVTGILNLSTSNTTGIITGLYGTSYSPYCTVNITCATGDMCIYDWDGTSATFQGTVYSGWCVSSATTQCMSNDTWYAAGSHCFGYLVRTCASGGTWSGTTDCSTTNQTCSSGVCTTPITNGGGGTTSSTNISSISITLYPSDFNITQGETVRKIIRVNNTGTLALSNVQISLSGILSNYYSFDTTIYNTIGQKLSKNFTLIFAIPASAVVGNYTIIINITTSNVSARDSKTFSLKILPSNTTIAGINSTYISYLSIVDDLEKNISALEANGTDVSSLRSSLNNIKSKLNQTNSSLASRDYFTAQTLLDNINSLINNLKTSIANAVIIPGNVTAGNATGNVTGGPWFVFPELPWLYIGIAIVVIVVIIILIYLFWPEKEKEYGYHPKHGWRPPSKKEEKKISSIVENVDKTKLEKKLDSILDKLRGKRR